jgi:hypothetical protein
MALWSRQGNHHAWDAIHYTLCAEGFGLWGTPSMASQMGAEGSFMAGWSPILWRGSLPAPEIGWWIGEISGQSSAPETPKGPVHQIMHHTGCIHKPYDFYCLWVPIQRIAESHPKPHIHPHAEKYDGF